MLPEAKAVPVFEASAELPASAAAINGAVNPAASTQYNTRGKSMGRQVNSTPETAQA